MNEDTPASATTIAVLLGASEFPRYPGLESRQAFAASAGAFGRYLKNRPIGLELREGNVLDLFDSTRNAGEQIEQLHEFLVEREFARDLIVYYCGYAALVGPTCYFVIRRTKKEILPATGLATDALGSVIRDGGNRRRTHMVLDCCVVGEGPRGPQLPIAEGIATRARAVLPSEGCALLAAASREDAALASSSGHAGFSSCLIEVLNRGVVGLPALMSVCEVAREVERVVAERFPPAARPALHMPQQPVGDVSTLPLFPNTAVLPWPGSLARAVAGASLEPVRPEPWLPIARPADRPRRDSETQTAPSRAREKASPAVGARPAPVGSRTSSIAARPASSAAHLQAAPANRTNRTIPGPQRSRGDSTPPSLVPPVVAAPRRRTGAPRRGHGLAVALGLFFVGLAVVPIFFVSPDDIAPADDQAAAAVAAPAASNAPPIDAAVRHIAASRAAIDAEKWSDALVEAKLALASDPGSGLAAALVAQAESELASDVFFRQFRRAVEFRDYALVADLFRRLDAESVYRVKALADHERLKAEYIKLHAREGKRMAERGLCRQQEERAAEVGRVWADAGREVLRHPCSAAEPAADDEAAPAPGGPASPAAPVVDESFSRLLDQSRDTAAQGQYARSLHLCELAAEKRPDDQVAAVTCAVAACRTRSAVKARKFLRRIAGDTRQQQVQQICLQEGVTDI